MTTARANSTLTQADVPGPDARWRVIEVFALTFDGYRAFGNALGPLAQRHREAQTVPTTLDELRAVVRASFPIETYEPSAQDRARWDDAYGRYLGILEKAKVL